MKEGVVRPVVARASTLVRWSKSVSQTLVILAAAVGCSTSFSAAGTETYQYDALGRLKVVTFANGTAIQYSYDAAGNRTNSGPVAPTTPVLSLNNCVNSGETTTPTPATFTCTLGNSGLAAASIAYSIPSGTSQTGPTSCAANTANCGTVVVSTPTTASTYTGALTATPNAGSAVTSAAFTLTVKPAQPPTLTVTRTPNPMVAGQPYTISWSTNGTSISYTCSAGGTGYNGFATLPQTVGSTPGVAEAGWVGYPSSCTWTATNGAATKTYSETLTTLAPPPAALTLSGCYSSGNKVSPTPATYTCTVGNSGAGAATSIAYTSTLGTTPVGVSSCAANTANCGTVVLSTPTAAGTYSGTLTATPSVGTAASAATGNLTVTPTPPTLSVTRTPNPMVAGQSYTVSWSTNGTSISYTCSAGGTGFKGSGPLPQTTGSSPGVAEAGWVGYPSSCTWTATNGTTTTTYSETLTTVAPPPAALTLSSCYSSGNTVTPTRATYTCTVGNSGSGAATSISYSSTLGTAPVGVSSCAANTANCGTVVVSTPTAAGTYSGTMTATPNLGSSGSSPYFNLTVEVAPPTLSVTRNPSPMVAGQPYTVSWSTNGTSISYICTAGGNGFNGSATLPQTTSSASGVAEAGWVGNPSSCTWTATNGAKTSTYFEYMSTVGVGTFSLVGTGGHTFNGYEGDTITFTIQNSGNGTISSASASCSGGSFYTYGNFSASTLAPGATGTVTCRAASPGSYNAARVTITGSNASNTGVQFGPY